MQKQTQVGMNSFPQRKSPRLQGYDYSQSGLYFITICTQKRQHLFGVVSDDNMLLNASGKVAYEELQNTPARWNSVDIDLFVVMPNHIHAIVVIYDNPLSSAKKRTPTLGDIVSNYKAGVTHRIRKLLNHPQHVVWQNRYHDHIIRTEESLNHIRNYVLHNSQLWQQDTFY